MIFLPKLWKALKGSSSGRYKASFIIGGLFPLTFMWHIKNVSPEKWIIVPIAFGLVGLMAAGMAAFAEILFGKSKDTTFINVSTWKDVLMFTLLAIIMGVIAVIAVGIMLMAFSP